MFSKSFFIFGLLALFACQGTTASPINEVEKLSLGELIDKVKEVISGLQDLVTGTISDALGTLGNLVNKLTELKDKYLQAGIDAIKETVGHVKDFIKNATDKATEIGVDISECVAGQNVGLDKLTDKLIGEVTNCVTNIVNEALTTVKNDIKTVQQIVANVTALPSKLSKCLISLKPIACVTDLLKDVSGLLITVPQQILQIVNEANALVNGLPIKAMTCITNVAGSAVSETTNIIADIAVCVEDKMTGGSSAVATRASLGELIDQVKEVIASLEKLVSGTIGDALGTLGNLIGTLAELKKKFLDEGISAITGGIGNVVEFIKNKTQEAAELGIDISKCLTGRSEQLEQLGSGLVANLTDCVTTTVGSVVTMINKDIKVINQIVANVTAIPLKLSKCLISLRPITCVTSLLGDVTALLKSLPGQIAEIVNNATELVKALPAQLTGCVENIATSTASQTQAIIKEIGTCVDGVISGGTA